MIQPSQSETIKKQRRQGRWFQPAVGTSWNVVLHAVAIYPRSVSVTWLAGCNPEGGGLVSSTAVSVSPLVCTISAGPFVVTFSITGILSSSAGLKEADIVTLCHLPGSQSKYLDIQELIHTGQPAFFLELQCRGTARLHDSLRWSEAIPGILCQCKYTSS